MSLPNYPTTRRETYLSKIAGQDTQLPDYPTTREEDYLDYIAKNGGGGGTSDIPTGGTAGQILAKHTNTDYDMEWTDTFSLEDAQDTGILAGKNKAIFNPYVGTQDGITISISDSAKGKINVNGTSTSDNVFGISLPQILSSPYPTENISLKAGTYVVSSPQISSLSSSFYIRVFRADGSVIAELKNYGALGFELNQDVDDVMIGVVIGSGVQLTNQKLQVMICTLADWNASNDYKPYSTLDGRLTLVERNIASQETELDTKISGKKVQATVSSTSVTFTDSALTSDSIIDGPYVAGYVMGIASVTPGTGSVTFTFTSADADGETAYIWIRG